MAKLLSKIIDGLTGGDDKDGVSLSGNQDMSGIVEYVTKGINNSRLEIRYRSIPTTPSPNDILGMSSLADVVPAGFLMIHNDLLKLSGDGQEEGKGDKGGLDLKSLISGVFTGMGVLAVGGAILKGLFSGSSGSTRMNSIVKELDDSLDAENLKKDPEVIAAQKQAFVGYLKTYYITQTAAMAVGSFVENLATSAGTAARNLITGLFGDNTHSYDKIQSIVDAVIDAQNSDGYLEDTDIQQAVKEGFIGYIGTYFRAQAAAMATGEIINAVSDGLLDCAKNLLNRIFGKEKESSTTSEKIANAVQNVISKMDFNAIGLDDETLNAVGKEALQSSVETFLKAQGEYVTEVADDAHPKKSEVKKVLEAPIDSYVDKVASSIKASVNALDTVTLDINEELTTAVKAAINGVNTAFSNQNVSMFATINASVSGRDADIKEDIEMIKQYLATISGNTANASAPSTTIVNNAREADTFALNIPNS